MSIRDIIEKDIAENTEKRSAVAVFLSGGIDSMTLAFSLASMGRKVVPYTFRLGDKDSRDSYAARKASEMFGWDIRTIDVPEVVTADVCMTLANKYQCVKKTQFECAYPFLYLYPEIKEDVVYTGVGADGHYGLSKRAMMHFVKTKKDFDKYRRDYFYSANPGGIVQLEAMAKDHGVVLRAPYRCQEAFDYFITFNWRQINRPKQKALITCEYPEFMKFGHRKHQNLQLVAGIDKAFEKLLDDKAINTRNRTRVMDLCRDIAAA